MQNGTVNTDKEVWECFITSRNTSLEILYQLMSLSRI